MYKLVREDAAQFLRELLRKCIIISAEIGDSTKFLASKLKKVSVALEARHLLGQFEERSPVTAFTSLLSFIWTASWRHKGSTS